MSIERERESKRRCAIDEITLGGNEWNIYLNRDVVTTRIGSAWIKSARLKKRLDTIKRFRWWNGWFVGRVKIQFWISIRPTSLAVFWMAARVSSNNFTMSTLGRVSFSRRLVDPTTSLLSIAKKHKKKGIKRKGGRLLVDANPERKNKREGVWTHACV